MALEDLEGPDKFPDALVRENPEGSDPKSEGDDHLRGVKNVIKNTFPNLTGIVNSTQGQIDDASIKAPANEVAIRVLEQRLVGQIAAFPQATPPGGWLPCIGGAQAIANYPTLWGYLGTAYGGDGVTTFGIPDYRGEFLRARDGGTGRNPDGDLPEGTRQAAETLSHTHTVLASALVTLGTGGAGVNVVSGTEASGPFGGNETRARNITVHFAIYAGLPGT